MTPNASARPRLLLWTVFLTNVLSLCCQVIWMRKIGFLFGTTYGTFSTVIAVFLLGLALGAFFIGRWIDASARPHRVMAALEFILGVFCLASLPLLDAGRALFLAVSGPATAPPLAAALKVAITFAVLLLPTFCIGAIFPAAVRTYSRRPSEFGGDVSVLYGLDTLGAAAGALLGGILLIPHAGLKISTAALGLTALGLGVALFRRPGDSGASEPASLEPEPPPAQDPAPEPDPAPDAEAAPASSASAPDPTPVNPRDLRPILAVFFFTGMAALLFETGWNRLFFVMNGTNLYSTSVVLAGFLTGMGAGSLLIRRVIDRIPRPHAAMACLFSAIALGGMLVFRLSGLFERFYIPVFRFSANYWAFQTFLGIMAFVLVFIATLGMGANFPLAIRMCSGGEKGALGRMVGRLYFVNTLGAVAGSLLGEFLILPVFGFPGIILVPLILYAGAAAVFLKMAPRPIERPATVCLVLIGAALFATPMVLPWELPAHGIYYHMRGYKNWQEFKKGTIDPMKVVYKKNGFYGEVSVLEMPDGVRVLKNNGKTDSSTTEMDNATQLLLAYLPLKLHPHPRDVLVIGLGGGITLRGVVHFPEVERIVQVEIDPLVVEAARAWFADANDHALDDKRVTLVLNDGRNFLDLTTDRYDVITSEPPNIWVSGVTGLFTREFYQSARRHLKPGGILCQWLPVYEMRDREVKIAAKTIQSAFPFVGFWRHGGEIFLIASDVLPRPAPESLSAPIRSKGAYEDLRAMQLGFGGWSEYLKDLGDRFGKTDHYIRATRAMNTDDRPVLEFNTARNLFDNPKLAIALSQQP